jgi:hypothetical protein
MPGVVQTEVSVSCSPITPAGHCPGFVIAPVVESTKVLDGMLQFEEAPVVCPGSQFGSNIGFTQRSASGAGGPTWAALDGL